MNTAFACDSIFIYVPDGNKIKDPVIILNISDTKKPNTLLQPRNLIISGKDSSVTLIDLNYTVGNNHSLNNTVTEIFADKNSELNLYKIQSEGDKSFHIGTTQVHQEEYSKFNSATISWGGSITRNNLNSLLNGEGCECNFDGAFVLSGNQHVDNHTLVDHAVPNCQSNEFYKGILGDNSVGVFNGKIIVRKDAQKTNAYQSNKNILLTKTAAMNSKPQLEIFADDVRCSHGATTGQLNEDELFYLRTRGIDKKEARITLLFAFASEIIQKIKVEPLKNILFDMLHNKLKKGS
ncbi:MAG: Fe-S cluster assembly protein SufD [Ignavibacteria bacterium]|nr:Fe-S cluster assembly protein SufD [Ignavibacteria bacterium]